MSELAWKPELAIHGLTVCLGVVTDENNTTTYRDVLTRLGAPPGEPFAFAQEVILLAYQAVGPAGQSIRLRVDLQDPKGFFRQGWLLDEFKMPEDCIDARVAACREVEFHEPGMYWFVVHPADDVLVEFARAPLYVNHESVQREVQPARAW